MTSWRFLLDENVDPKVATYLEKEELFAVHVRDALELGADDQAILSYARNRGLIVVTSDVTDFGTVPNESHAGIVLLYDDAMPGHRVASALLTLVDTYPDRDAFHGHEELDRWA
jgi:hypothetical protein